MRNLISHLVAFSPASLALTLGVAGACAALPSHASLAPAPSAAQAALHPAPVAGERTPTDRQEAAA